LVRPALPVGDRRMSRGGSATPIRRHRAASSGVYPLEARRRGARLERRSSGRREARVNPLIELDHVSRTFATPAGAITAVDAVSLALGQGEAMCLVGESGCGKTTTGRLLTGLLRP